jgi:nucleosome assembly protein 1-like 1
LYKDLLLIYLLELANGVDLINCYFIDSICIFELQITERDEAALKYIKDIKWSNLDENKGFILEFYFDSNPYFKNPMVLPYHFSITLVVSII